MIIDNINQIRYRVRAAAARVNRDPDAVRLVAVTKYAPLEAVRTAVESGLIAEVGENRVQDAERKKIALGELATRVRWRLIGHLQTNKAKKAVDVFDVVDSVDSEKVASALDAALWPSQRVMPVLAQVKLTEKDTQFGAAPTDLPALIAAIRACPHLQLVGLMGIAPALEPVEAVRPSFRELRRLRDEHLPHGILSMGMSRDFEVAVEEGADLIRIGSQIFSQP